MSTRKPRSNWVFSLDDERGIPRQLADGLSARIFVGDHSMLSVVLIAPHSTGKVHSHPEEQWGILLEGECIRIQEGEEVVVKKGDFWHTPANASHGIRTLKRRAVVLDVFSPPRPEYRNAGRGFGQSPEKSATNETNCARE